jgi:hypothetical protein
MTKSAEKQLRAHLTVEKIDVKFGVDTASRVDGSFHGLEEQRPNVRNERPQLDSHLD